MAMATSNRLSYLFNIKASSPGRDPRPLRDPDVTELDEDDGALD
ncbi:hypothetical protein [Streptomyces triculaminicus]